MQALLSINEMEEVLSPYLAKKALEKVYRSESFKYVIDKMVFVDFPRKQETGSFLNTNCVVTFHVKSTHKGGKPLIVKALEKKIQKMIEKGPLSVSMPGLKKEVPAFVGKPTGHETSCDLSLDMKDMLLNVEATSHRTVVKKVFDAHMEHGVIDLRHVKPRIITPPKCEMVHALNESNDLKR